MNKKAWNNKRESPRSYNRRVPELSSLYRVVYHNREELEYKWEDLYQRDYGSLRREFLESFDSYLDCGILANGCARVQCDACEHSRLIAFSCKGRGICPSCAAKRAHIFAENIVGNILLEEAKHSHIVFIPITNKF